MDVKYFDTRRIVILANIEEEKLNHNQAQARYR
jgi:hypothetical protein